MPETRPSFPFYAKDWLASTRGLSGAARGYHIDMLALSWLNGGCDLDPETLRRSVGAEKAEWRRVWPELATRWQERDGRMVNPRLERVREEATAYSEARALAGSKGGKAKAAKLAQGKQTPSNAIANALAETYPSSALALASATTTDAQSASVDAREPRATRIAVLEVVSLWNASVKESPIDAATLTPKGQRRIADMLAVRSVAQLEALFQRISRSDYATGRDGQHDALTLWRAFDQLDRIEAGDFDDRRPKPTRVAGLTGGGVLASVRPVAVAVTDPDYNGAEYRFHCDHTPACTRWPQHRDHEKAVAS